MVLGESVSAGVFLDHRFVHPDLGFSLSFPKGWQYANAPTAVAAQPEDESAVLVLQVAAEGNDPVAVADEVESQVSLLERSELKEINGMPAVTGVVRIVERGQEIFLSLAWIAKDDVVYQVLGATLAARWNEHRPSFEATAESFRDLSQSELDEVRENRLRLVAAKHGETLNDIAKRSGSEWSPAKMAVTNAMTTKSKLSGGESIKISKQERYQPSSN